jgi:hypothetical protein
MVFYTSQPHTLEETIMLGIYVGLVVFAGLLVLVQTVYLVRNW